MGRLERANPVALPLKVRAWLGQTLTDAEQAELAALPPDPPYVPPSDAEMAGWSSEAQALFVGRLE
jgi:hypothetical protein